MTKLVSGFLNTDVMNFVACPECSQPEGSCCNSYKGKKQSAPHKSRLEAYLNKFRDRAPLYEGLSADRLDRVLRYNQKLLVKSG